MKAKASIFRMDQVAELPLLPYRTFAPSWVSGKEYPTYIPTWRTDTMQLLSTSGQGAKGQRWRI